MLPVARRRVRVVVLASAMVGVAVLAGAQSALTGSTRDQQRRL
jgi:hypothetical protein